MEELCDIAVWWLHCIFYYLVGILVVVVSCWCFLRYRDLDRMHSWWDVGMDATSVMIRCGFALRLIMVCVAMEQIGGI